MKKRRGLTIEELYKKDIYKNIIFLIARISTMGKKIKFLHLKYLLVKNHKIDKQLQKKLNGFFEITYKKEIIRMFKEKYGNDKDKKESYEALIKSTDRSILDSKFYNKNIKRITPQNLSNHLEHLKKLYIISVNPVKGGFPYYTITKKGKASFYRYCIKTVIDQHCPDEKLETVLFEMTKILKKPNL